MPQRAFSAPEGWNPPPGFLSLWIWYRTENLAFGTDTPPLAGGSAGSGSGVVSAVALVPSWGGAEFLDYFESS